MSSRLRQLARRAADDRGVATLEFIISIGVWLLAMLLFVNMFFILGTSMLVQTALSRTAQQTAALGCLSDAARTEFIERQQGLGGFDFELVARTPRTSPADYTFDRSSVVHDNGTLAGDNALCEDGTHNRQRDKVVSVTNGDYIWLRARYTQRLVLLPGMTPELDFERSALVISNSLRDDPPGGNR